jgi:hypothetical protein
VRRATAQAGDNNVADKSDTVGCRRQSAILLPQAQQLANSKTRAAVT